MIEVRDLSIALPGFALRNLNFSVPDHAYCTLMGPTGTGKTTIVEAICGLRRIDRGQILLAGRDISRAKPGDRNVGYVPQDAALFPTMRVRDQIEFGLRLRGWCPVRRRERVEELAELLSIGPLLGRRPPGLSGGERQRVALARALAFLPRFLCLDEPLSALDEVTRERMHELLRRVHRHEHTTALHITHSQEESRALATHVLRLVDGRVEPETGTWKA
jgi:ABC-type sugar transport system ATPase subunit